MKRPKWFWAAAVVLLVGAPLPFLLYHPNRGALFPEDQWYGWPYPFVMSQFDSGPAYFAGGSFAADTACGAVPALLAVGMLALIWPRRGEELETTGDWDQRKPGEEPPPAANPRP
ncbi:MAG: hypothetical protein ACREJ2_16385 [Planctomycetota bacterium]